MNQAVGVPKINSIGVEFKIDVGEDISAATTTKLIFLKPDGAVSQKDETIEDSQYLVYTTIVEVDETTLLDQAGLWKVIAYVEMPGFSGYGEVCQFRVEGMF